MPEPAPHFVYTLYIAAPPERVWSALTDGDMTRAYWGHENRSDWKAGSRWEHVRIGAEGKVDVVGRVIEIDPPRRLAVSWAAPANEGDAAKTSRVTYELTAMGAETRLTVAHTDISDPNILRSISDGWPGVLSSLKSFVETGEGLALVREWVGACD